MEWDIIMTRCEKKKKDMIPMRRYMDKCLTAGLGRSNDWSHTNKKVFRDLAVGLKTSPDWERSYSRVKIFRSKDIHISNSI